MKYILFALLLFSGVASAQFTPTGSKTRFVNGIGLGSKLDAAFGTADSLVLYTKLDSTLMFKYKGTARALAYASALDGYVTVAGTQTVTGAKTFTDTAYFKNIAKFDSTVKIFKRAIISPTGLSYAQVTGVLEDGPALFINRDISNASTVNEHGIIDATTFSRSGKAYNSYDAQTTLNGSSNLDHYTAFQNRAFVDISGYTLNAYNAFHSAPYINSGSVDTLYHFRNSTVIGASATSTLLEYGLKIGTLRGIKKYGVYVDVDSSYFGNSIIVPSGIGLSSIKTNNARLSLLKLDAGTNRTSMTIADDFLMKDESSNSLLAVNASTKAVNTYGVLTAKSASTSTNGLLVVGGSSVGSPSVSSGQILLGNTSAYRGSVSYDDNTGYMYIDNLYDNANSNIYLRTRTNGTPINALSILGSGIVNTSSRLNVNGATDNAAKALNVNGVFGISALNTAPSSASDTGVTGEIRWDANYMYVCVATNTWKRSAIATW